MKKNKVLLYGKGISNLSISKYFDKLNIPYFMYEDGDRKIKVSDYKLIIKCPGIKPDTILLDVCERLNLKVITDLELFYLTHKNTDLIGVTGSNGKTTVVTLIQRILNTCYNSKLGGNIGIPLFDIKEPFDKVVIECSSFMLKHTYKFKPHIFIILNIEEHHLDYHGSFNDYFDSKTKCINNMDESDIVIYDYDNIRLREFVKSKKVKSISFSSTNKETDAYICNNQVFLYNTLYMDLNNCNSLNRIIHLDFLPCIIVAKLYHIDKKIVINILNKFTTLPHRCEIIYQNDNLVIINDSKATSPVATFRAFEFINTQFKNFQTLFIGGGKLTNDDFNILNMIPFENVTTYLYGENKVYLFKILNKNKFNIRLFPNLKEIIDLLKIDYNNKYVILFSPAAPSLDMFKSYIERGNYFKENILNKIKEEQS